MALLIDANKSESKTTTTTYSPTISKQSTIQYSPNVNYSPQVAVTYPNYSLQINSPFASAGQTSRADPQANASFGGSGLGVSAEQKPDVTNKPAASAMGVAGIDPVLLIAGAVAVVAIFILIKSR